MHLRHTLDRIYLIAGWCAAGCILAIACLVTAQISLNLITRAFGIPATIPSYADFAGFLLAAASFLAAPWTMRSGGHIRVSLVTSRLPATSQRYIELGVLVIASLLIGYAFYYIVLLIGESWQFGDVSPGIIAVPLWIPQTIMGVGMGLLLVSLLDALVTNWVFGKSLIPQADNTDSADSEEK